MRGVVTMAVMALLGCDGPVLVDAGPPPVDAGAPFAEPTPPAPPVFTPCPAGWSTVSSGEGFEVCEPPTSPPCAPGTERFVDEAACAPIGAACPTDEWAEPPASGAAVYVRAGATGGSGTRAAPYGTIADAIVRAPPGATLLLARGTYDETLDVFGGLTVRGACAAETILAPSSGGITVRAAERGITLTDVTIRPASDATAVEVTGELTLRSVVVERAVDEAILVVDGGALDASRIAVRDIGSTAAESGRGLTVTNGTATVDGAIFERCPGGAILASRDSHVVARAVLARESGGALLGAPQIIAQGIGGSLEIRDSVVEDGVGAGLFVSEDGSLRADQVVVRRNRHRPEMANATAGVFGRSRGRFEGTRVRVLDSDFLGFAFAEDATAQIEDTFVGGVVTADLDGEPIAIGLLYSGPDLTARRLVIRDVERIGVQIEGAALLLEDVSMARTGEGATTDYQPMGFTQLEGDATLRRVRVAEARGAGIFSVSSTLTLEDVAVVDTPGIEDGRFGRGVEIDQGSATLSRVLVEAAREIGVYVSGGARVDADALRVVMTRGRDCQDTTCADAPGGLGLATVDATVSARGIDIDGARLCGVMVTGPTAELDLRGGRIASATVGACVQVEGYDLSRLTDGVEYRDNGIPLDATDHATPPPTNPLGSLDL
ncbi:MAG: hypothetical protein H6719_29360 [Sandaracinaceae bacterium]|nr:hypothetical protein [Sandaracinaceae bacterium]